MELLAAMLLAAQWAAITLLFTSVAQINFGTSALFATVAVWPLAMVCVLSGENSW
jgi:hypothetical protein